MLEQCSSNLAPEMHITKKNNNTYYVVAMATFLIPIFFFVKPNIPICNLFKGDRGSYSEHTWFHIVLIFPIRLMRDRI